MLAFKRRSVFVTRFLCRLPGGSQPILAEASDGKYYVVKFADNLQGQNLSFNEAAGTELYRAYSLPVASWQPLLVTYNFLDRNRACWIQTPEGLHRPTRGLCFGSRYIGHECRRVFEILPGSYIQRVTKTEDFWLAWLIDICAAHTDNRQAIFLEQKLRELNAVFIDFGHMFGGANGNTVPHYRASRYCDARIYAQPTSDMLLLVRKRAASLDTGKLWGQLTSTPSEWKKASAVKALAACLNRIKDSWFVERSLQTMADSLRPGVSDEVIPGTTGLPPASILRSGLQAADRLAVA